MFPIRTFLSSRIVLEVAREFGIRKRDVLKSQKGKQGGSTALEARYAAALLLRNQGHVYHRIGHVLGYDHTSALHAVKSACERMKDVTYRAKVKRVRTKIRELLRTDSQ